MIRCLARSVPSRNSREVLVRNACNTTYVVHSRLSLLTDLDSHEQTDFFRLLKLIDRKGSFPDDLSSFVTRGVEIQLISLPSWLIKLRRLLSLPKFIVVGTFEKFNIPESASSSNASSYSSSLFSHVNNGFESFFNFTKSKPVLPFRIHAPKGASYIPGKYQQECGLKEIVIGAGSSLQSTNENMDLRKTAQLLVRESHLGGGKDNCTLIMIRMP